MSSFGFGGTNAHVVLEEAPRLPEPSRSASAAYLLPLSARSGDALAAPAAAYEQMLRTGPALHLGDVCFTAAVRAYAA